MYIIILLTEAASRTLTVQADLARAIRICMAQVDRCIVVSKGTTVHRNW